MYMLQTASEGMSYASLWNAYSHLLFAILRR